MPVIEHKVTRGAVGAEFRYGCLNRPDPKHGYFIMERAYTGRNGDGGYALVQSFVPSTGTKECRHDKSLTDPACAGCARRGTGEAYDRFVRENGR